MKQRVVIGVTGATGVYAGIVTIVQTMLSDTHSPDVISSRGVEPVLQHELSDPYMFEYFDTWGFVVGDDPVIDWSHRRCENLIEEEKMVDPHFYMDHMTAELASGSYETAGMIVIPCSMNTLSSIAIGRGDSLLTRAADVTLKENRPLVLCIRETPLSKIHIDNIKRVSDAGAIIMPVCLPLYLGMLSREAAYYLDKYVARVLSQLGIKSNEFESYKPTQKEES